MYVNVRQCTLTVNKECVILWHMAYFGRGYRFLIIDF